MSALKAMPKPFEEATATDLSGIQGICLDIDETLSTRGKLTGQAYQALWDLKGAGFILVPVTGRPAGWCDHIARFWPVDAVIGENGAFAFFMQGGVRRRLDTPGAAVDTKMRLHALSKKILERFPKARFASDQNYRESDLAIDVCEDVTPWPREEVEALLAFCRAAGAHAKLSSIHVNTWFGDFDKRRGVEHWLSSGAPGTSVDSADTRSKRGDGISPASAWLFVGDSPNDEPMFEAFAFSVGVANLRNYLQSLSHPPRWITQSESGAGFAEMARKLIAIRTGHP